MDALRTILAQTPAPGQTLEIEARFGHFSGKSFISGIPRAMFYTLLESLIAENPEYTEEQTLDVSKDFADKERLRVTWNLVDPDQPEIKIKKHTIRQENIYDFGVRISASTETPTLGKFTDESVYGRKKQRYSFPWGDGNYRLDLTIIRGLSNEEKAGIGYVNMATPSEDLFEVELELLPGRTVSADAFINQIRDVYNRLYSTFEIYTQREREELFETVNRLLKAKPSRERIENSPLVQARNLHYRDLVWGGIVGNPTTRYVVTHKADGQRAMLVCLESGIWLVSPPYTATLISREPVLELKGTIIDGELVPRDKRKPGAPNTEYWYLAFDCLAYDGKIDIQQQIYVKRMTAAQNFSDAWIKRNDAALTFTTKSSYTLDLDSNDNLPVLDKDRVEQFFIVMRRLFAEQKLLVYEQDGFVFTPAMTEYNPHSSKLPLYKRSLTYVPDVCKWKPVEKMTIDFLLTFADNSNYLYTQSRNQLEEWYGTVKNPFNGTVEKQDSIPYDVVIEFAYNSKENSLRSVRPRYDKPLPNGTDIANDNWDWIFDPITPEVLQGYGLKLVFNYHNKAKTSLYDAISKHYGTLKPTLLDIGSGRGGDVWKWKDRFSKIVAVEPNSEHRKELESRIEKAGISKIVKIVAAGGEETQKITEAVKSWMGKADAIVMMLSLSFFWSEKTMLDSLANTINTNLKPNGLFAALTVDGNSILQMFDPPIRGPVINTWLLGPDDPNVPTDPVDALPPKTVENTLSKKKSPKTKAPAKELPVKSTTISKDQGYIRYKDRKVLINIPGTIVENQTEWPVFIYDLVQRINLPIIASQRTDTEPFLTPQEQIYTQLFTAYLLGPEQTQREFEKTLPVTIVTKPVTEIRSSIQIKSGIRIFPWLPVQTPKNPEDPGIGDDIAERLPLTWSDKIVRIATIGDGSCYLHGLLKATSSKYQENSSYKYRVDLVTALRRDLAALLAQPTKELAEAPDFENRKNLKYMPENLNIDYKYRIVYETAYSGGFVKLYDISKDIPGQDIEASLTGLQERFNSIEYLGEEAFAYFAEQLGIDVIVLSASLVTPQGQNERLELGFIINTRNPANPQPIVVILGNTDHFEVLAQIKEDYYQTVFPATSLDDPESLPALVLKNVRASSIKS